jgi:hypothetical protein
MRRIVRLGLGRLGSAWLDLGGVWGPALEGAVGRASGDKGGTRGGELEVSWRWIGGRWVEGGWVGGGWVSG